MKCHRAGAVFLGVLGLLLGHEFYAGGQELIPVVDTETRLEFYGFAIRPPKGENWYLKRSRDNAGTKNQAIFARKTGNGKHTVVAETSGLQIPFANENTGALLQLLLQKYERKERSSGRTRSIDFRSSLGKVGEAECAFYDFSAEDRGVPKYTGTVFTLRARGLHCVHPDFPSYLISMQFSQRTPPGVAPLPLDTEREGFFKGLEIKPLDAHIRLISVGRQPQGIAVVRGDVWVASFADNSVARVDANRNKVVATIPVGKNPVGVAEGAGSVWIANKGDGTVSRIDTKSERVTSTIPVGIQPLLVAFGAASVWVTNGGSNSVSRIDPVSNRVIATVPVGREPAGIAASDNAVWVTSFRQNTVSRIDPVTNRVMVKVRVGDGPNFVLAVKETVWVVNQRDHSISRIDSRTDKVVASIPLGLHTGGIAFAGEKLWVVDLENGALSRIDPQTNRIVGNPIPVGQNPLIVAASGKTLWVGNLWDGNRGTLSRVDLR